MTVVESVSRVHTGRRRWRFAALPAWLLACGCGASPPGSASSAGHGDMDGQVVLPAATAVSLSSFPCGTLRSATPGQGCVGTADALDLCCDAETAVDVERYRPGSVVLSEESCVAGLQLTLRLPCSCVAIPFDPERQERPIPTFTVELTNCGDAPFIAITPLYSQLGIDVTSMESGPPAGGLVPGYASRSGRLYPIEESCPVLPGQTRSVSVGVVPPCAARFRSFQGSGDVSGQEMHSALPPMAGWYALRAKLVVGGFTAPSYFIVSTRDAGAELSWVSEVLGVLRGLELGPDESGDWDFPVADLDRLVGFHSFWPWDVASAPESVRVVLSNEALVYIDYPRAPTPEDNCDSE